MMLILPFQRLSEVILRDMVRVKEVGVRAFFSSNERTKVLTYNVAQGSWN